MHGYLIDFKYFQTTRRKRGSVGQGYTFGTMNLPTTTNWTPPRRKKELAEWRASNGLARGTPKRTQALRGGAKPKKTSRANIASSVNSLVQKKLAELKKAEATMVDKILGDEAQRVYIMYLFQAKTPTLTPTSQVVGRIGSTIVCLTKETPKPQVSLSTILKKAQKKATKAGNAAK